MAITTSVQAVAAIQHFANGTALPTTVTDLAGFFKHTVFQVSVGGNVAGGVVNNYWVGTSSSRTGLRFEAANAMLDATNRFQIPSVLIVAMINADSLKITTKKTVGIERLESILFPPEDPTQQIKSWRRLDLGNATAPRIVLTSQLSGCTFAIGSAGNHVYMGHAQPNKDVKYAKTGKELAEGLGKGEIFDGLPEALESTFLIHAGDTKSSSKGVGYGDVAIVRANVMGVVQGGKLYFIVVIVSAGHDPTVEKVLLVSRNASRQWTSAVQ